MSTSFISLRPNISLKGLLDVVHGVPEQKNCRFYKRGRDALRALAITHYDKCKPVILMPDYICKEAYYPFVGIWDIVFYKTTMQLHPYFSDIYQKIDERVGAVLFVNYFGMQQPSFVKEKFLYLQEKYNFILIEDSTHCFWKPGETSIADYCIYSFRKSLPTFEGCILLMKKEHTNIPILSLIKTPKKRLEHFVERLMQIGLSEELTEKIRKKYSHSVGEMQTLSQDILPMSKLAYDIILSVDDLQTIQKQRLRNFMIVVEKLSSLQTIKFIQLPQYDDSPWRCIFIVPNPEELIAFLQTKNIPATRWPDEKPMGMQTMHTIWDQLVTLPIHESLTQEDCLYMSKAIREFYAKS